MTKRMLAVLPLICILTIAMGGSGAVPPAASSTTPSMTVPNATDFSTPADPGWGGCRWYCGSKSYSTYSACQANCASPCEPIC